MKTYHKEKTKCLLVGNFNYEKVYGYNTIFVDMEFKIKAPYIGIFKELELNKSFLIMKMKL